jgi:hypothetical protein
MNNLPTYEYIKNLRKKIYRMRVEKIFADSKKEAKKLCPWALSFKKAHKGIYVCYESVDDWFNDVFP